MIDRPTDRPTDRSGYRLITYHDQLDWERRVLFLPSPRRAPPILGFLGRRATTRPIGTMPSRPPLEGRADSHLQRRRERKKGRAAFPATDHLAHFRSSSQPGFPPKPPNREDDSVRIGSRFQKERSISSELSRGVLSILANWLFVWTPEEKKKKGGEGKGKEEEEEDWTNIRPMRKR